MTNYTTITSASAVGTEIDPVDVAFEIIQTSLASLVSEIQAAEQETRDPERREMARVLSQRFGASVTATFLLIEKLQSRPVALAAVLRQFDAAEDREALKAVIRSLSTMRVQDRIFDQAITELYEACHARLQALEATEEQAK